MFKAPGTRDGPRGSTRNALPLSGSVLTHWVACAQPRATGEDRRHQRQGRGHICYPVYLKDTAVSLASLGLLLLLMGTETHSEQTATKYVSSAVFYLSCQKSRLTKETGFEPRDVCPDCNYENQNLSLDLASSRNDRDPHAETRLTTTTPQLLPTALLGVALT